MSEVLQGAAVLCTVLGLVSGALVLAVLRDVRLSVGVLLDLLLAAGLLRLSDDPAWQQLGTAAVVVALRRVLPRQL